MCKRKQILKFLEENTEKESTLPILCLSQTLLYLPFFYEIGGWTPTGVAWAQFRMICSTRAKSLKREELLKPGWLETCTRAEVCYVPCVQQAPSDQMEHVEQIYPWLLRGLRGRVRRGEKTCNRKGDVKHYMLWCKIGADRYTVSRHSPNRA
jgi:hypothetical protein